MFPVPSVIKKALSIGAIKPSSKKFRALNIVHHQAREGQSLASFRRRANAFIVDMAIVCIILILVYLPGALEHSKKTGEFTINITLFHGWELLVFPLYFGLVTWLGHGRTIGKRLFKIRVLSLTHDHLSLWHSIERSLGYSASFLEFGFGFIQYFIHPNCQTVHDRIAETIVVEELPESSSVLEESIETEVEGKDRSQS